MVSVYFKTREKNSDCPSVEVILLIKITEVSSCTQSKLRFEK